MNIGDVISPISANQVVDVPLIPPACAPSDLCTLTDWLKWLSEAQCVIDWTKFDLSCIGYTPNCTGCPQTQKDVITAILSYLCTISSQTSNQSVLQTEVVYPLVVNSPFWSGTSANPLKGIKKSKSVQLQGTIVEGTVFSQPVTFLPLELRPLQTKRFPVAHTFPATGNYHLFVEVQTSGNVIVVVVGTDPSVSSNGNIYLDSISYYVG